jgi:hypothetical protein
VCRERVVQRSRAGLRRTDDQEVGHRRSTLFPWFFVAPGVLVAAGALAVRRPIGT